MPHVHFITHTQPTAFIATELLQEEHTKMFHSGSLFPQPLSLPYRSAGAAVSWTCLKEQDRFCKLGWGTSPFGFSLFSPPSAAFPHFYSASTQLCVSCSRFM